MIKYRHKGVLKMKVRDLTLTALFIALGILLPFITGQLQSIGSMLLPMHLPVMIGGLILPLGNAAIIGFVTPILRSLLFTMPPLFPKAIAMAFELLTYGVVISLVYNKLGKHNLKNIYIALIIAMIAGRIIWGLVTYLLVGIGLEAFISSTIISGIPGIILQLIFVPFIVRLIEKKL